MTSEISRYTTDLLYPSAFVFGQTPLYMQWAAIDGAPRPSLAEPFTYCDLGCGDAITLNVLAAEYPQGRFTGVDLNPDHLQRASDLARRAGLDNIEFRESGFAGLPAAGLAPMDFIVAHGVYSWIDADAREALHGFVSSQLKPGGLFGLQYASLPGCTVQDPLYSYLRRIADRAGGESMQRFAAGRDALQKLRAHSAFFREHPQAGALLDSLQQYAPGFVAHDVLNRGPHSQYCHEVHDAMAALGLRYLGSADLHQNNPELLMTRDAYAVFEDLTQGKDRRFSLITQDLMLNTRSRFDVFQQPDPDAGAEGKPRESRACDIGRFHLARVGTSDSLDARRRMSAAMAVNLASDLHSAVLESVGETGAAVDTVLNSPLTGKFDRAAISKAIAQLLMTRNLNLLAGPMRSIEYRPDRRYRMASRINSILLDETFHIGEAVAFASPVLGSALMIPSGVRFRLAAWLGRELESAWRALEQARRGVRDSRGVPITSLEAFRSEIGSGLPGFVSHSVPELLRLGLIEEAGPA